MRMLTESVDAVLCDYDEHPPAHVSDCHSESSLYQGKSSRSHVFPTPRAEGGARGFVTAYYSE